MEVVGQLVVQHPRTDLEKKVCAWGVQRMAGLLTIRLLITWFTVASTKALEVTEAVESRNQCAPPVF